MHYEKMNELHTSAPLVGFYCLSAEDITLCAELHVYETGNELLNQCL